jgi:hypothetical protein
VRHVAQTENVRNSYEILVLIPRGTGILEKLYIRGKDNIKDY